MSAELLPRPEWDIYLTGYRDGCRDGIDLGRQQVDDEISTLQRGAHRVVMAMTKLDPHHVAQDRRRQAQVEVAARHEAEAQPWPGEVAS